MQHIIKKLTFLALLFWTTTASAAIIENRALSFGTFGLRDNAGVYTYVLSPLGAITADFEIVVIDDGLPGDYTVSGFPVTTALTFNVLGSSPLTLGGTGSRVPFPISNFTINPNPITTDGAGNASFTLGATLSTDGLGTMYSDGVFSDSVLIVVSF